MPGEHLVSVLKHFNWNDYVLFAAASLLAIGIFIAIALGNYNSSLQNRSILARGNTFLRIIFGTLLVVWILVVASTGLALGLAVYARHAADAVLATLTGAAFGALTARFVWSLFGPNFVVMEAVLGAGVFVLLSIAYSLPVYKQPIFALFDRVGITSVKTPVAEFTFAERATRRPVLSTGSQAQAGAVISGIPRPSDPTPGLVLLDQDVSPNPPSKDYKPDEGDPGFAEKDRMYIAFFGATEKERNAAFKIIDDTKSLLQPMHNLAHCLQSYVTVVKDAQLLAIDLKSLLQQLFKIQTISLTSVENGEHRQLSWEDWDELSGNISKVMAEVYKGFDFDPEITTWCDPQAIRKEYDKNKEFTKYLSPWQPYLVIALSSLLMAHGSTDEGIDVLAKWLDSWKCAREGGKDCNISSMEQSQAKELPEWLGFRTEFQMNILLNQWAGSNNIIYLDFLHDHAARFRRFAETNGKEVGLDDALVHCEKKTKRGPSEGEKNGGYVTPVFKALGLLGEKYEEWRVRVTQLLLDEENDTLLAERNFLFEADIPELETLYQRAKRLARFTPDCIEPRDEKPQERVKWSPVSAAYRVTAGLLGLAVAERMGRIADSAYDRNRGVEIRKESTVYVRDGYRILKDLRNDFRGKLAGQSLSKRVFATFGQEEAYATAGQAIERLNASEP